ncbi:MAG: hypothetical protein JWP97_3005 [Labilithrix sp.]|nr:hypothetical protein [Labilithrix sp.]
MVEPGSKCHADSECTDGLNGRCVSVYSGGMGQHTHRCSYDECFRDDHCPAGRVCDCRTSAGSWSSSSCTAALCRTDADCTSGFCRFSAGGNLGDDAKDWLQGWACRAPSDECFTEADCRLVGQDSCVYRVSAGHFVCLRRASY